MVTRIYANAVAKYNEGKLLDAEKLRRLIDADFADAVKMLCDYGYGNGNLSEGSYDIDAFISAETGKLVSYVLRDAPDERLARVLTARFIYGNVKAYYKERSGGKANVAAVYALDDDEIRAAVLKGEYAALPAPMADALEKLDSRFAEARPDPKVIDTELTKAMYADMRAQARRSKSKTLRAFVAAQIDVTNILSALRARALNAPLTALGAMFIEGGRMEEDEIAALYASSDPMTQLRATPYDYLADGALCDLPHIEARADDYLAEIWEAEAENMQSLSPFVHYFTAQLSEYKTVKTILTCSKHNVKNEIASRLRHSM